MRVLGSILLLAFLAAAWLFIANMDTIITELPSDSALIGAFVLPVALAILSVGLMMLFGMLLGEIHPDGDGAVAGTALAHLIGLFSIAALMASLYHGLGANGIPSWAIIPLLSTAGSVALVLRGEWAESEERREKATKAGYAIFLASLLAMGLIVGTDSPDIISSMKGTILLFLLLACLLPAYVFAVIVYRGIRYDQCAHVSGPEIFFPYILCLALSVAGAVFGALGYLLGSLI